MNMNLIQYTNFIPDLSIKMKRSDYTENITLGVLEITYGKESYNNATCKINSTRYKLIGYIKACLM